MSSEERLSTWGGTPAVIVGIFSALISALGTFWYLFPILVWWVFYPIFIGLLVLILLFLRRADRNSRRALLAIGLGISALLMPLAGQFGITVLSDLDPKDSGWNHHPTFYAYTSALVALVLSVRLPFWIARRRRHVDQSAAPV